MAETGRQQVPPRVVLTLGLADQAEVLAASILASNCFRGAGSHAVWLRDRYIEIMPAVLPDALRCLERGEPLHPETFDVIRASARSIDHSHVPLCVVLRGGLPALRAFSAFMASWERAPTGRELVVLMGRAALVASELGACWAVAWADFRDAPNPGGTPADLDPLDLVPVPGTVGGPELEMLALVANGHSNDQIGEALGYSPQAVRWHLARAMREWKVCNRAALVSVAFLRGLLMVRRPRSARPAHGRRDQTRPGHTGEGFAD